MTTEKNTEQNSETSPIREKLHLKLQHIFLNPDPTKQAAFKEKLEEYRNRPESERTIGCQYRLALMEILDRNEKVDTFDLAEELEATLGKVDIGTYSINCRTICLQFGQGRIMTPHTQEEVAAFIPPELHLIQLTDFVQLKDIKARVQHLSGRSDGFKEEIIIEASILDELSEQTTANTIAIALDIQDCLMQVKIHYGLNIRKFLTILEKIVKDFRIETTLQKKEKELNPSLTKKLPWLIAL